MVRMDAYAAAHLTQKHTIDVAGRMQRNRFSKHQAFMPEK